MHTEHFLVGLITGIFAMYMIALVCKQCNVSLAGLDNRPRWMMGGLRDDTGSHNAKDVFGMGFGLNQTKNGVATVDGQFDLNNGLAFQQLGGKRQSEYNPILGDKQLETFMNKKSTSKKPSSQLQKIPPFKPHLPSNSPQKQGFAHKPVSYFLDRSKDHFLDKAHFKEPQTSESYLESQLR